MPRPMATSASGMPTNHSQSSSRDAMPVTRAATARPLVPVAGAEAGAWWEWVSLGELYASDTGGSLPGVGQWTTSALGSGVQAVCHGPPDANPPCGITAPRPDAHEVGSDAVAEAHAGAPATPSTARHSRRPRPARQGNGSRSGPGSIPARSMNLAASPPAADHRRAAASAKAGKGAGTQRRPGPQGAGPGGAAPDVCRVSGRGGYGSGREPVPGPRAGRPG